MRTRAINVLVPENVWKRVKYAIVEGRVESIRVAVTKGLNMFLDQLDKDVKEKKEVATSV
jgi:hypothetical protein